MKFLPINYGGYLDKILSSGEKSNQFISAMRLAEESVFRSFETIPKVIEQLEKDSKENDCHWTRELSYSLALNREFHRAAEFLEQSLPHLTAIHPWQQEIFSELQKFLIILRKSPEGAVETLKNDAASTLRALLKGNGLARR